MNSWLMKFLVSAFHSHLNQSLKDYTTWLVKSWNKLVQNKCPGKQIQLTGSSLVFSTAERCKEDPDVVCHALNDDVRWHTEYL